MVLVYDYVLLYTFNISEKEELKDINSASILEVRKNIAMELLWVQQAINSRKNVR